MNANWEAMCMLLEDCRSYVIVHFIATCSCFMLFDKLFLIFLMFYTLHIYLCFIWTILIWQLTSLSISMFFFPTHPPRGDFCTSISAFHLLSEALCFLSELFLNFESRLNEYFSSIVSLRFNCMYMKQKKLVKCIYNLYRLGK